MINYSSKQKHYCHFIIELKCPKTVHFLKDYYLLLLLLCIQISSSAPASGMHSISSSEDIKPPFGLQSVPTHSPGLMLSQKRLCVICGDRSSGKWVHQGRDWLQLLLLKMLCIWYLPFSFLCPYYISISLTI